MKDFAAIDFETANNAPTSVCSVGVVVVRDGQIAEKYYSLIRPEPEWYMPFFTQQIHGIGLEDTADARVFPEVWSEVAPLIEGLPLVAHNSPFDEGCLRAVMRCYRMDWPDYRFFCTYRAARKAFRHLPNHKLDTVASHVGFDLANHHHALADAEACAAIALDDRIALTR